MQIICFAKKFYILNKICFKNVYIYIALAQNHMLHFFFSGANNFEADCKSFCVMKHESLLTGCVGMSRGEEICVLNSLRFDFLGLLFVSVVISGSGDFKTTFAIIFLAVGKKTKRAAHVEI